MIDIIKSKFTNYKPYINGHEKMRKYSVLIPIVKNENNETCILFEVRAKTLKTQPSEISFPGGKLEGNETSEYTAIRETCEELGTLQDNLEIISALDLFIHPANMIIHPYVGKIKDINELNINKDEVDRIFLVPLDYLMSTDPDYYGSEIKIIPGNDFPYDLIPHKSDYKFAKGNQDIIFYNYQDYVIWGITAKILENFITELKK